MPIFSRIFGGHKDATVRDLHESYTRMLCTRVGWSREEAAKAVSDAITMCKDQGKSVGTYDLPEDFGNRIVEAARLGEAKSKQIVEKARREGAVDDDIREWWNLPDLDRRMVIWSENMFRYSVFLVASEDDGLSAEEAAARVHKMVPDLRRPRRHQQVVGRE